MLSTYDILVLLYLTFYPNSTTTAIAKEVYGDNGTRRDAQNADNKVRHRLHKLEKMGLVMVLSNSRPKRYSVNPSRVLRCTGAVVVVTASGESLVMDLGDPYLAISNLDGNLVMVPVENIWSDDDGDS